MSKPKKHSQKPGAEKIAPGPGKRGRKRKAMCLEDRPILEGNAAGIDIGAREIYVAVPPDRDAHPVRVCSSFTEDLEEMAQWLVSCGATTATQEICRCSSRQHPCAGFFEWMRTDGIDATPDQPAAVPTPAATSASVARAISQPSRSTS